MRQQLKEDLFDAFAQLYFEKPLDKITVRELTATAGISRSAFYTSYESVEDVLREMEQDVLDGIRERESSADNATSNIIDYVDTNRIRFKALFGPHGNQSFEHQFLEHLRVSGRRFVSDPAVTSQLHLRTRNDTEAIIDYIAFATMGMLKMFVLSNYGFSKDDMVRYMTDFRQLILDYER